MADSCECGNEPTGSKECAHFFWLVEDLFVCQDGQ